MQSLMNISVDVDPSEKKSARTKFKLLYPNKEVLNTVLDNCKEAFAGKIRMSSISNRGYMSHALTIDDKETGAYCTLEFMQYYELSPESEGYTFKRPYITEDYDLVIYNERSSIVSKVLVDRLAKGGKLLTRTFDKSGKDWVMLKKDGSGDVNGHYISDKDIVAIGLEGHLFDTKCFNESIDICEKHKVNFSVMDWNVGNDVNADSNVSI